MLKIYESKYENETICFLFIIMDCLLINFANKFRILKSGCLILKNHNLKIQYVLNNHFS